MSTETVKRKRFIERYPQLPQLLLNILRENPGIRARDISGILPRYHCMDLDTMRITFILKYLKYHNYAYNDTEFWYPRPSPILDESLKPQSTQLLT